MYAQLMHVYEDKQIEGFGFLSKYVNTIDIGMLSVYIDLIDNYWPTLLYSK